MKILSLVKKMATKSIKKNPIIKNLFTQKFKSENFFNFLHKNKIAFDIRNYRKAKPGIRIWTGPTIKKNDLIALTNWLDWSFKKFIK